MSNGLPATPPVGFRDRSVRRKENNPPVSTLPMSPPVGFREISFRTQRSMQHHQQERSGRQSRSLRRTQKDDYHRSPSPVPPPPNGFRDSLPREVNQIPNEATPPRRHQQIRQKKSQSGMESSIKTIEKENVRSASPAPPPPLGFKNSVTPVKRVSSQHFVRSPSPPKVSQK